MTAAEDIISPRARRDFLARPAIEAQLLQALNDGALANGWLIAGGEGAGKATLAFRLARALLWRERPAGAQTLDVPETERVFSLVASAGHPDLFVAERKYDEKKERHATEISIEVIRELTHFLNHTASMGGWRVAIIDTADDLNRNSANALLKALEEPPPRTAIFVLSAAPGRLLATIRSRCRRLDLRPLEDETVAGFLLLEGAVANEDEANRIARVAGGRPGFALSLALGEGRDAIAAVDEFWSAAHGGGDVSGVAQRLAGKAADGVWPHFHAMLIARLASEAKSAALARNDSAGAMAALRERLDGLFTRGDAVNLDRMQIVMAAARAMNAARAPAR